MNKSIIFLNGPFLPTFLAKSKSYWNKPFWNNYHCLWYSTKMPISNFLVEKELQNIKKLIDANPSSIIVGHSFGAWWIFNLILYFNCKIDKLILWKPLIDLNDFPIHNVTNYYNISYSWDEMVNRINGKQIVKIFYAKNDIIASNTDRLINILNASSYPLDGGHLKHKDHQAALIAMKEWIELKV